MLIRITACTILVVIAVIYDFKFYKIPNWLIKSGILVGLILILVNVCVHKSIMDYLLGWILMFIILFPVFLLRGIGAGDVKLFMTIGLIAGWLRTFEILKWTAAATLIVGIICMIKDKGKEMKFHRFHMSYAIGIGFVISLIMEYI